MCETLKTEGPKKLVKLLNRFNQNASSHQQGKFRILQNLYGCRAGDFYEFGLSDALNKNCRSNIRNS